MNWINFVKGNKQAITNRNRVLRGLKLKQAGGAFVQLAMDGSVYRLG